MSVVLLGSTSGSVTLQEPAVAGSTVIDLPATSGTMAVTSGSPSFTNITATGTLTVNGNTTLGDASTDTILMTGAPSIGGAGLGMGMGFRNRIINGAMVIDQRNAGASQSITSVTQPYTIDRFVAYNNATNTFTTQQSSTAPSGFSNSLVITNGTATSATASMYQLLGQRIEAYNFNDFAWGTASAKALTVSFWVYTSQAGTYSFVLRNGANNRFYPQSFSVASANTWTQITQTVAGDTSGTWAGTNGIGLEILFSLSCGSSLVGTSGAWSGTSALGVTGQTQFNATASATFYITGVQLEKGSTATSFDYRPIGTELQLAQRYFEKSFQQATAPVQNGGSTGAFRFVQVVSINTRQISCGTAFLKVTKRANPTVTLFNPEAANSLPRNSQRALDWTTGGLGTVAASESVLVFNDWTSASSGGAGDDFTVQWTASSEL